MGKLSRIVAAGRGLDAPQPMPDAKTVAAAAQAFTERARARMSKGSLAA